MFYWAAGSIWLLLLACRVTAWLGSIANRNHGYLKRYLQSKNVGVWENGGVAPLILNSGISWQWGINFTLRPIFHQETSSLFALNGMLGWRCRRLKVFAPVGYRTAIPCPFSLVTTLTELFQLFVLQAETRSGNKIINPAQNSLNLNQYKCICARIRPEAVPFHSK
jgi:hypothetical protein